MEQKFGPELPCYPPLSHGSSRFQVDDQRTRWFRPSHSWESYEKHGMRRSGRSWNAVSETLRPRRQFPRYSAHQAYLEETAGHVANEALLHPRRPCARWLSCDSRARSVDWWSACDRVLLHFCDSLLLHEIVNRGLENLRRWHEGLLSLLYHPVLCVLICLCACVSLCGWTLPRPPFSILHSSVPPFPGPALLKPIPLDPRFAARCFGPSERVVKSISSSFARTQSQTLQLRLSIRTSGTQCVFAQQTAVTSWQACRNLHCEGASEMQALTSESLRAHRIWCTGAKTSMFFLTSSSRVTLADLAVSAMSSSLCCRK